MSSNQHPITTPPPTDSKASHTTNNSSTQAPLPFPHSFVKICSPSHNDPPIFTPHLHFFYGALTSPSTLSHILHLPHPPVLCPAKILGYQIKHWGPLPALVDGARGDAVHGVAYEVRSREEEAALKLYGTDWYGERWCGIEVEGRGMVVGRTFEWAGGRGLLR